MNEESSPTISVPSISRAFSRDRVRICSAESADKAVFSILTIAFAYSEVPSTGSLPRSVSACVSGSAEDTSLSEGTKINTENQTFIEDALELELFERCEIVSRHISFDLDARRYSLTLSLPLSLWIRPRMVYFARNMIPTRNSAPECATGSRYELEVISFSFVYAGRVHVTG